MNEFEDLFSYQHLSNCDAFLDNIVSFFNRKYADEKAIPQDRIKACLEGFYHNIRNMDESHINKAYLERAYKSVFPNKMHSEMRASLKSRIVQALKGLVVVVAISSLLERQGFVHPSSTLSSGNVVADAAFNHHIPPIYQPHHVYDEFQTWLHYYNNTYHPIQLDFEEYSRLVRFYHVSKIILKLFGKGNRLKGLYLFVGACLEGIPDPSGRIYAIGGQMTELTKRRESIYMRVTGVSKRKRANKPNLNKPDQKNKRRSQNSPSYESRSVDQNYSADEDEQQYFSSSDVSEIDELEDCESLASFPQESDEQSSYTINPSDYAAIFAELKLTAY